MLLQVSKLYTDFTQTYVTMTSLLKVQEKKHLWHKDCRQITCQKAIQKAKCNESHISTHEPSRHLYNVSSDERTHQVHMYALITQICKFLHRQSSELFNDKLSINKISQMQSCTIFLY